MVKLDNPLIKNLIYPVFFGFNKGLKMKGGSLILTQFYPLSKEELFLKSLKLKNKIVFDVGGYVGLLMGFFSKSVGEKGKVVTFEPNPYNCLKINQLIALNRLKNVKLL